MPLTPSVHDDHLGDLLKTQILGLPGELMLLVPAPPSGGTTLYSILKAFQSL